MQIQVNPGDFESTDAIDEHVNKELEGALRLFESQITRVEVHLRNNSGPRASAGKRCLLEARLAGHQPMAVEHDAPDLYLAITGAAGKLERAIRHKLERREEKRS